MNNKELDDVDTQILKQLEKDGRKSYRQIAEKLDLSVGTITNRVNKLKDEGIIKGFQLEIDYKKLGYTIETIIELDLNGKIEDITDKYPDNIISAHKTTGQYDGLIITRFKDTHELNQFLEKLTKEENVEKTYTRLILNKIQT